MIDSVQYRSNKVTPTRNSNEGVRAHDKRITSVQKWVR